MALSARARFGVLGDVEEGEGEEDEFEDNHSIVCSKQHISMSGLGIF